ncbi:MAG: DUF1028 domain-containing protein [candidate division Zixibacteria bacterium]|nr:DUF1028 domain-containing protein [candidate division Zixibacteria bacterium]
MKTGHFSLFIWAFLVWDISGDASAAGQSEGEVFHTFSIVACDPANGDWGVAVQSKAFAVGARVPYARAGVGAVATQATTNPGFGPRGLSLLEKGLSPQQVIDSLLKTDDRPAVRQLAVIDARGLAAVHTGDSCIDWKGSKSGPFYSCQGNLLAGQGVVDSMAAAFERASGELAERLMAALEAGQRAGGDSRGMQSAALIVARAGAGYGGFNDRYIDIRTDDSRNPIRELRRLLNKVLAFNAILTAETFRDKKDYERMVTEVRRAVALDPVNGHTWYQLGCYLAMSGRLEEAKKNLKEAFFRDEYLIITARSDSDLDNLVHDQEFRKMIGMLRTK